MSTRIVHVRTYFIRILDNQGSDVTDFPRWYRGKVTEYEGNGEIFPIQNIKKLLYQLICALRLRYRRHRVSHIIITRNGRRKRRQDVGNVLRHVGRLGNHNVMNLSFHHDLFIELLCNFSSLHLPPLHKYVGCGTDPCALPGRIQ